MAVWLPMAANTTAPVYQSSIHSRTLSWERASRVIHRCMQVFLLRFQELTNR
jgi:hypothetical protein